MRIDIIHDGDHGSDDFIASLMFLAHPETFNLLGITTGFGNTNATNAARNALAAVAQSGRDDVPVFRGSEKPFASALKQSDDAFDENGLSGIEFPAHDLQLDTREAVTWMAETLRVAHNPVTLCLTGLMTNAARLLRDHPDIKGKIARIVVMGGCIGPLGPGQRHGNITPFAEFNMYMDPEAAAYVLNSGVPIVLLPMDATHMGVFTPARQRLLAEALPAFPGNEMMRMMRGAEKYDIPNFGLPGAVFHDHNVPAYLLAPHLYKGRKAGLSINIDATSPQHGQLHAGPEDGRDILLIETLDADGVFGAILDSLVRLFAQ